MAPAGLHGQTNIPSRPIQTCRGAPEGHTLPIPRVGCSAGAGFVVVICGEIMTMPALPRGSGLQRSA